MSRIGVHGRRLAVLVACVLVAASCGLRLDDGQLAARLAAGGGEAAAAGRGTVGAGPAAGVEGGGSGLAPGASAEATGTAGGTGSAAPGASAGAAPAPATGGAAACPGKGGATEVGVTADEIKVGNVSSITGPVPGAGTTGQQATRAYLAMVNAQGGVCGRKLTLVTADDRLDASVNRSETQRLAGQVLGFAGMLSIVDEGGAQVLQGTNIPDVTLAVGDARIALANNFSVQGLTPGVKGTGQELAYRYMADKFGAKNFGIIWLSQVVARTQAQNFIEDAKKAGLNIVYTAEVAPTESNFTSHIAEMRNKGVDFLAILGDVNVQSQLRKQMIQQGWEIPIPDLGSQVYGSRFLKLAGSAANGVHTHVYHALVEDAGAVPAMAQFKEWYNRVSPGADYDFFAVMSWAGAAAFVKALRMVGADVTRDKMIAALRSKDFTAFTADGALAPVDMVNKRPSRCFLLATVKNGQWVREDPPGGGGFVCK